MIDTLIYSSLVDYLSCQLKVKLILKTAINLSQINFKNS